MHLLRVPFGCSLLQRSEPLLRLSQSLLLDPNSLQSLAVHTQGQPSICSLDAESAARPSVGLAQQRMLTVGVLVLVSLVLSTYQFCVYCIHLREVLLR